MSPDPYKEHIGTYFMDQSDQEELTRLTIQDHMLTAGMGGVLAEQTDAAAFRNVLDVACGTSNWLMQAAQAYPSMKRLIGYARSQAQAQQVQDRVEYHAMQPGERRRCSSGSAWPHHTRLARFAACARPASQRRSRLYFQSMLWMPCSC
jgi:hypothetical protein